MTNEQAILNALGILQSHYSEQRYCAGWDVDLVKFLERDYAEREKHEGDELLLTIFALRDIVGRFAEMHEQVG